MGAPAFKGKGDNPYCSLLFTAVGARGHEVLEFSVSRLLRGGVDILHVHWPERILGQGGPARAALRLAATVALYAYARARGTKIVWTVHNLKAHESRYPVIERVLWWWFVRQISGVIVLSPTGERLIRERLPSHRQIPIVEVPHGHYFGVYPDTLSRDEARRRLGLRDQALVIGFLGSIRPYKNVRQLIDSFRKLNNADWQLVVAGQPLSQHLEAELRNVAGDDSRITLHFGRVEDDHIQDYLRSIDLMVLPYKDVLNSGSVMLSLTFDCPVLVPEVGAMTDLRKTFGSKWVITYPGELTGEVLESALESVSKCERPPNDIARIGDWNRIADRTISAYCEALSPSSLSKP